MTLAPTLVISKPATGQILTSRLKVASLLKHLSTKTQLISETKKDVHFQNSIRFVSTGLVGWNRKCRHHRKLDQRVFQYSRCEQLELWFFRQLWLGGLSSWWIYTVRYICVQFVESQQYFGPIIRTRYREQLFPQHQRQWWASDRHRNRWSRPSPVGHSSIHQRGRRFDTNRL